MKTPTTVRTKEVPASKLDYLTVNREYQLRDYSSGFSLISPSGWITDDQGDKLYILLGVGCAHLDLGEWEVV